MKNLFHFCCKAIVSFQILLQIAQPETERIAQESKTMVCL